MGYPKYFFKRRLKSYCVTHPSVVQSVVYSATSLHYRTNIIIIIIIIILE